jgi:hypothetical protein
MMYRDPKEVRIEQRTIGMTSVLAGVLLVLIIQLWLITVALEAHLSANPAVAIPTFAASLICFAVNICLLRYLYRLDAKE